MGEAPEDRQRELLRDLIDLLSPAQLEALSQVASALQIPIETEINPRSDFASEEFVDALGIKLAIHHAFSEEAFTKDKFEHALEAVFLQIGTEAALAPRGNPGHDISALGERWSLKTQADAAIRPDLLHISKFMELGRGAWEVEEDLEGLRSSMFRHMEGYDRIFSLRCLSASRGRRDQEEKEYELVEIPKELLLRSADFPCEMRQSSTQTPKPGYCRVMSEADDPEVLLELYFDGGTERKLQIKKLSKAECVVHASWRFMP